MISSIYKNIELYLKDKIKEEYLLRAFINKYYYYITLEKELDEKVSKYDFLLNP